MQLYSISLPVNKQQRSTTVCMLCKRASCLAFLPKQWPIFKTKGLKHHELATMGFKPSEAKDILNLTFLG